MKDNDPWVNRKTFSEDTLLNGFTAIQQSSKNSLFKRYENNKEIHKSNGIVFTYVRSLLLSVSYQSINSYLMFKQMCFLVFLAVCQSCIGSTGNINYVSLTSVFPEFFHLAMFAHLCACSGLQCNYWTLNKRFQGLLVQLYQIHATCKCVYFFISFLSHTCVILIAKYATYSVTH